MQKKIMSISPDAQYFFRLALDAEAGENPQSVLEYFDRAIAMEPAYASAWNEKANFLDQMGELDMALVCYDRALTIDPNAAEAWFNKGLTLKKMGRDEDAVSCINRGIELAIG
ncbi:MAG: tetratricopeptide repeat protein [Methanomicrobiales archaeon]|nr:tetratricopeptide repeat protein [Methanomicrobiales archaeon]